MFAQTILCIFTINIGVLCDINPGLPSLAVVGAGIRGVSLPRGARLCVRVVRKLVIEIVVCASLKQWNYIYWILSLQYTSKTMLHSHTHLFYLYINRYIYVSLDSWMFESLYISCGVTYEKLGYCDRYIRWTTRLGVS